MREKNAAPKHYKLTLLFYFISHLRKFELSTDKAIMKR